MLKSHSVALTAIAAALALPLAVGSAQAAVVGSFDPAFGSSIPNLGFRGQITMELSAGCAGLMGYQPLEPVGYGGGYGGYGGGCSIQATSAYIDFYNSKSDPTAGFVIDPNDLPSKTTLAQQNLTYADFGADYIYGAYFDANGMLLGIDTNHSNTFNIAVTDDSDPAYFLNYNDGTAGASTGDLSLYFVSGFQITECINACTAAVATTPDPAFLDNTNGNGTTTSNAAVVTFASDVPEPDSIALAGLGLAALAASRRRRLRDAR